MKQLFLALAAFAVIVSAHAADGTPVHSAVAVSKPLPAASAPAPAASAPVKAKHVAKKP